MLVRLRVDLYTDKKKQNFYTHFTNGFVAKQFMKSKCIELPILFNKTNKLEKYRMKDYELRRAYGTMEPEALKFNIVRTI